MAPIKHSNVKHITHIQESGGERQAIGHPTNSIKNHNQIKECWKTPCSAQDVQVMSWGNLNNAWSSMPKRPRSSAMINVILLSIPRCKQSRACNVIFSVISRTKSRLKADESSSSVQYKVISMVGRIWSQAMLSECWLKLLSHANATKGRSSFRCP